MTSKPIAPACERNRDAILPILRELLKQKHHILEIGSDTGQHAVYFAKQLPHLTWQRSDLLDKHEGIQAWIKDSSLTNVKSPLALDIQKDAIALKTFDGIFTANTFHIIPWKSVLTLIEKSGNSLTPHGLLIIYGPFNFKGQFTSDSNAKFNKYLIAKSPHMGIRNFE